MFKPARKMRVLNWKKLPQNTIRNSELSLWKKNSSVAHSLTVNGDQIVELFSRAEIAPKAKEEQTKEPSVVRQQVYNNCVLLLAILYRLVY